jgi:hypothetical protein
MSLYDSYLLENLRWGCHWDLGVADYIQADKLNTLIKAAKIEDVEPIWSSLFAKVRRDSQLG